MNSRVFMITGGNGGIGKAIATAIARSSRGEVILVGRNKEKCDIAVREIKRETQNNGVSYEVVDLASYHSIKSFAKRYRESGKPLHVLINNAAIVPNKRELSPDGLELQWATNVMAYYWMMREFRDVLANSAPARVVNVASNYAGELDLGDVQFQKRKYEPNAAYRQSKQANRQLSAAIAEAWKSINVSVNACHPGVVGTTVLRSLGFGNGYETPEEGAATPVMLATTDVGQHETGKYFSNQAMTKCRFSEDKQQAADLLKLCEEITVNLDNKAAM